MGCLKLLVRHFFGRFFDNEIVSQSGDMRTNVVQAFGLVATPGLMVPFYMIPQRARFDRPFADNWILLSDYYFFIMFSMVVMGFVMVFEWDALFPDRKDYLILTPLPLGGGSIFAGKTLALVLFLGLFALDAFGGPGAFPRVSVQGLPRGLGESGVLQRTSREARTLALDFTRIQRRHTLTFGFMGIDFRQNSSSTAQARFDFERRFTQGPDPNQPSGFSGSGIASLLLGTGSGGGITYPTDAALQKSFLGWYFNDDFKLRRNLTVNLGIRYDFQTAPTERFDRLTYWTLERNSISDLVGHEVIGGLRHTGGGNPRGVYDPQYTNVAPRIGLTWSPLDRLVARAGFGMFYMPAMKWARAIGGPSSCWITQETPTGHPGQQHHPAGSASSPFRTDLCCPRARRWATARLSASR
jgi:hypothetical protein